MQKKESADFSSLRNQPAITLRLGQQTLGLGGVPPPPLHSLHTFSPALYTFTSGPSLFPCSCPPWKSRRSQESFSPNRPLVAAAALWSSTQWPCECTQSASLANVYCLVKLPVCSCVSLIYITHYNTAEGFCLSVRLTRSLTQIRGGLAKYLLQISAKLFRH